MKPGLELVGDDLIFTEFPIKEVGTLRYCNSFSIRLYNIKIIAISPRLAIDDEMLFILIVDKDGQIHALTDEVLSCTGFKELEKNFTLGDLLMEWEKFSFEDHYAKHDKIVFPKELYWQDLFADDLKLKFRKLLGGFISTSLMGNLSKEALKQINFR